MKRNEFSDILNAAVLQAGRKMMFLIGIMTVLTVLDSNVLGQEPFRINTSSKGVSLDIIKDVNEEIFRRLGHPLVVRELPSERSLILVNEGIDDADGMRIEGLEKHYPNLIRISEPYMINEFLAFSKDKDLELNGWDSLKPFRICYVRGWKVVELNIAHIEFSKKPYVVASAEQMFKMLDSNRTELAIFAYHDGMRVLKATKLEGIYPILPALEVKRMGMYVNKKHVLLIPKIEATLKEMKKDGTYSLLMDRIAKK